MWLLGLFAFIATAASMSTKESGVRVAAPTPRYGRSVTYISYDRSSYFRFCFARCADGIRIYVLVFPRPEVGSCHVLRDAFGSYICWTDSIPSMESAKSIAALWAEATLLYQRSGRAF